MATRKYVYFTSKKQKNAFERGLKYNYAGPTQKISKHKWKVPVSK